MYTLGLASFTQPGVEFTMLLCVQRSALLHLSCQCHICVSIPVDGRSSWLKFLVIVNHAAVDIHAQVSFYTPFDFSWVVKLK